MLKRNVRKSGRRLSLKDDTRGSVLLEASLVMPMVVLLIAGIADYGITLYQYHTLSTATGSAVRQLIVSRGFANPYDGVTGQYATWAPNITVKTTQITVSVEDSAGVLQTCNSNSTCKTALDAAAGRQAKVSLNFPCTTTFLPNMISPCPIKASASGMVE
ncbi:TadE/TadG family type IV pilus assembly protein [Aestuariivirga sp.]|uniref:TadE/TadG family type IV pilus assembly protein n=1 Tax=Aestuariivirga sp. TaxID=2650926 RepID=UPI0035B4F254